MSAASLLAEAAGWIERECDSIRTLTNIACLVGNQFRCDACSIYLLNPATGVLTLGGTVGLRQECVGQIQMRASEGLTGLCARRRCPVVVPTAASARPEFRYFPEAGEDLYDSFYGVPLENGAMLVGVLVLQTFGEGELTTSDINRLSALGRELGPHLSRIAPALFEQLAASDIDTTVDNAI
ncbi:MAG: GAF domain-containing protein [Planctomycetaceae bacterium]